MENIVADALPHFQFQVFHNLLLEVDEVGAPCPEGFIDVGGGELTSLVQNSVAPSTWVSYGKA